MLQPSFVPQAAAVAAPQFAAPQLNVQRPDNPFDAPEGVKLRAVGDVGALRESIYDSVLRAASEMPEVVGNQNTLRLTDLHYAEDDPEFDAADEKKAILSGSSLSRRLRGTWNLIDNATGESISSRKATVANVPAILRDGSFLRNGTRYAMGYQQRLKPGAYARYKKSGEPEVHINAASGSGRSHRYVLEPETGLFHVHIEHAKIPLVPLLQTLGVTREQIESAWGKELTDKNFAKQDSKAINKLYERFVSKHEQNAEDKAVPERVAAKIQQAIASIKLDPEVVDNTLGRASDTLDGDLILKGTSKALRMLQGQEDADDRDNLAFASYHGAADIFAERFMKDYGKFRRELLYKAGRKGTLDSLPSGALDKYINAAIFRSGLAQGVEEVNPLEIAATRMKITRFGEGGLADATSAPAESRDVHPSQFGYIDGITTPECQPGYCQVMTREGWVPWSILRDDQELACMIDGRLEWHKPVRVIRKPYVGEMVHTEMRRLVDTSTPGHRMWVRPVGHGLPYRFEPASKLLAGASRNVMCGGHLPYVGDTSVTRYVFGLPGTNRARPQADTFAIDDWAALLGWYLSEGNTTFVRTQRGGVSVSNVNITKVKTVWPEQYAEIAALLDRMKLRYQHKKSGCGMVFSSIPIAEYLSQFGKSHEKFVPDCVFDWPVLARQAFVRAITTGDGRRARDGRVDSYSSTSLQLVKDVQRLLFGLGVSTSQIIVTPDDRSETYHDLFEIHIHKCDERSIQQRNGKKYCQPLAYSGMVYCAEVPGGLIYTRHPDSPSGIWTGNSLRIGIDGFLAANSMIGSDNKLYAKMIDNKTGRQVVRSPDKLLRSSVSLGNAPMEGYEMVSVRGRLRMLPKGTAAYSMPNMEDSFSVLGNMVPMKGNMFGQRASMGARMASQAMALETPQAPWVQTGTPDDLDESFEERLGNQLGAIRSEERGRVVELGPDHVTVKYAGGREQRHVLDNNRPGARKSIFHQTPMVELGQEVEPNQLLVKSNYVDDKGVAALGTNARTALMAWPDAWEDGEVVSQSFADRTRIQQAYKYKIQPGEGEKVDKRGYLQLFGNRYKSEQLANIGNDGIIKVGTTVKEGDPLMLGMRKRDGAKTRVHKQSKMDWGDSSVRWDHSHEGVVTDVFHSDKGSQVVVKTSKPLEEGDKLAGRFGNKGVITIKPDSEMPHDQEGNVIERIVSPLAVPSRGNSSFPLELLLGKIAAKRGAPFKIKDFRGNDLQQMAMAEAEANGVNDTETLIDPKTGRKIPGVLTGQSFVMALHHLASSKSSARGLGTYSADDSPARGGEEGAQAKRYSGQMAWAGMSHGAYNMSREATLLRGVRNDDYWNAFMGGEQIAPPRVSPQYDTFIAKLQASGINPIRSGTKTQLMAMIDADVDDLAGNRIVTSPDTVDVHKDLKPLPNGLFDSRLFGDGTRWAAIQLPEPMPNPSFEEPLRRMLGLTEKEFREVLGGKKELGNFGSGPDGLKKRLDSMDIDQEITKAREAIAGTRKVARDEAVKRLKYLKALKETDTKPSDLMITKVPVLPPRLRPISKLGGKGGVVVSDPNFLYRELMFANEVVSDLKGSVDDLSAERLAVYDAHRALVGLTDPASRELRQRKVKGLIKQITGDNPKSGVVQRKLISGNVDTVGRGVIAPDTSLDMDSFGLPENLAFDMYQPYIVRNMALRGIPRVAALEHLKNRDDVARRSLLSEIDKRPVTLSRAPILHKYGDIALQPRLIKGDTIRLNPLVFGPLGADNDGNCVDYHEVLALAVSLSALYTASSEFFELLLEAAGMRLSADEIVSIRDGNRHDCILQVKIGEFPRVGEPTKPKRGQLMYVVPDGVQVLSYDHDTGMPVWAAVDSFTVDLEHVVVEVSTARKRKIVVSDNESLAVLCEETCEIHRKSPADSIGKHSPSLKRVAITGTGGTFDEGWLYAAAVANGWRSKTSLFGYSHNSMIAREKVLTLVREQWGDNFTYKEYLDDGSSESKFGASAKLHISGPSVAAVDLQFVHPDIDKYGTNERQWIQPRKGDKPWAKHARPALYKRIDPAKFSQWGEEAWLGFLCGYLENDGSLLRVEKSGGGLQARVAINTSSPYLIEGLQHVLRMLGIRYSIGVKPATAQSHAGYSLCLSNIDIDAWLRKDKLRFYTADANTWLAWRKPIAMADNGNDMIDYVPVPKVIQADLRELITDRPLRDIISEAGRNQSLGRSRARRIAAAVKDMPQTVRLARWVQMVASDDVHWDRIVKVEPKGVREVYDIGVPETKVFAVNSGLVVWDTVNLNIPHSREAVSEAFERMLPSKMLIATSNFKSPMFKPTQDLLLGLHIASKPARTGVKTRYFGTLADAKAALNRGDIDVDTPVKIGDRPNK